MRHLCYTLLPILGLVSLLGLVPSGGGQAQPAEGVEDRAVVLRRLIDDVEHRRRVLVKHRGGPIALSADSLGILFASAVLTGDLPVDSIGPRIRKVREDSDFYLSQLKSELAQLPVDSWTGEYRRWTASDGKWSMDCQGQYPPLVHGQVGGVERVDSPDGGKRFHFDLYRDLRGLVTPLDGTVEGVTAKGERRPVQIPGPDFDEFVGTLSWTASLTEKQRAGSGVDGTITVAGKLRYTGNEGRCDGQWEAG